MRGKGGREGRRVNGREGREESEWEGGEGVGGREEKGGGKDV